MMMTSAAGVEQATVDQLALAIKQDVSALAASDPDLARAAAVAGDFPVRLRQPGFASMVWLILGQQVSIAAAAAMYGRLASTLGEVTPAGIVELDQETMQACGFTRQKARYARDLAEQLQSGTFSFETVAELSDAEAIGVLTSLRGIGPWTAENYLIWALGRRDIFPAGDLALRIGWQWLADLAELPDIAPLREIAERWAPRRTAAGFLIWHYYLAVKAGGA